MSGSSAFMYDGETDAPSLLTIQQADSLVSNRVSRPQSAPLGGRRQENEHLRLSRDFHTPESYRVDNRSERVEREVREKEREECTFHPSIRPLPSQYASDKMDDSRLFHERVQRWQVKKSEEINRLKEQLQSSQYENCTFKPAINTISASIVSPSPNAAAVSERLYKHQSKTRILQLQSEIQQKQEEEFRKNCTFTPQISRPPKEFASQISSRYMQDPNLSTNSSRHIDVPEFSFTPRVNKVPVHMGSAQLYLQTNAFERLSRPRTAAQDASFVSDENSFISWSNENNGNTGNVTSYRTIGTAKATRPSSAPRERINGSAESEQHASKRDPDFFIQFLQRQNILEANRQDRLARVQSSVQFQPKPELCPKSKVLAEKRLRKSGGGDFLTRVEQHCLKREQSFHEMAAHTPSDCTFQPQINDASRVLKPRTAEEMSVGDMMRKENSLRAMKLQIEKRELEVATFKPKLTQKEGVSSRLKVVSDPDTYIERIQKSARIQCERAKRVQESLDEQATKECTFKPKIHEAPAYVTRIAKSMALTRAAKKSIPIETVREWR
eukprot:GILK01005414.1.p1 GENE.GILK01005414.1~~GILK01005414.1.p1  ORF type:complete len:555 (-),score=87.07 GILK01005414.1:220-1884(-)